MEQLKRSMIRQARRQYKEIYPCGCKGSLLECFTAYRGQLSFWFNTADNSTRLITWRVSA